MAQAKSGSSLMWMLLGMLAQAASSLQSSTGFVAANVGDNVTLQCFYKGDVRLYWYKQSLGQKPRLVSSFYKFDPRSIFHNEFKNDSRFSLDYINGQNHLKITNLRVSDSAVYFCAKSYTFNFEFTEGTVVDVRGAVPTARASVRQAPSESVRPGDSVTLNCTVDTGSCHGQHHVYWFKESEGPDVGLIYATGGDRCERGPGIQTRNCVYSLPMKSLNRSETGTYYCAVASCGHIVLGAGTRVHIEGDEDPAVLMYVWGASSALAVLLSAVLAFSVFLVNKREHCSSQDSHANLLAAYAKSGEGLCYVAAKEIETHRSGRGVDDAWSECVYFGVKQ